MNLLMPQAEANPLDFSPPLLRLQDRPPNPLGHKVLWALLLLLLALLLWATSAVSTSSPSPKAS